MSRPSRREFLKTVGVVSAATALPDWFIQESVAQATEKPAGVGEGLRLGLIGCGGMGSGDAQNATRLGARIVALCDVDTQHMAQTQEQYPDAKGYADFRELLQRQDLDAVICGTVDHWHTLVAMAAMKAGKDIYCEKPLTLTIDEGKRLVKVQKETQRIVQTGTQQRSNARFRLASEAVRNGRIGKVKKVEVWLPMGKHEGPFKASAVPAGFNYDFWQGQTPDVPYVKERTHVNFRFWWEYSGGTMTDWGAHHNDIVLWALDKERTGPVSAEGKPLVEMIPGGYTAHSAYEVTYTYADGIIHTCNTTAASAWNGAILDKKGQPNGIKFIGSDGWIWVNRDTIDASERSVFRDKLPENADRLYVSNNHMGNFLECIKSRKQTICPAEIGHRSASLCHIGSTAIRLGRKLHWDPVKELYINDTEANQYVAREMRKPYGYDML